VVGTAVATELGFAFHRAFLWDGEHLHDLNGLVADLPDGVRLGSGRAIGDSGEIVARTCPDLCLASPGLHRSYLHVPAGPAADHPAVRPGRGCHVPAGRPRVHRQRPGRRGMRPATSTPTPATRTWTIG
jgi:hypothetical protein